MMRSYRDPCVAGRLMEQQSKQLPCGQSQQEQSK
jgi:hypothetical protein